MPRQPTLRLYTCVAIPAARDAQEISLGHPFVGVVEHDGPVIVTAIHDGDRLRREVSELAGLSVAQRRYEEDPYTREFIPAGVTAVVVNTSRFEVDLNRPRESAVYVTPEQSWGLDVWRRPPPPDVVERSLGLYDEFYAAYESLLRSKLARWDSVIVLDLHSYNHRRDGAGQDPAPVTENPEVNLGTRTMPQGRWDAVTAVFSDVMTEEGFDIRENVRFGGGNLARWTHENFEADACVLAVEFKKVFMDEWTDVPDAAAVERIAVAMERATSELARLVERRST